MDAVPGGVIGGTYGGNALACAAGLKVLEIIERDKLCERSMELGEKCRERFGSWTEKYGIVGDVRGLGGMIGVEFVKDQDTKEPATEFVGKLIRECAGDMSEQRNRI